MIDWISVKQRLPEADEGINFSKYVLIRTHSGLISFGMYDTDNEDWFPAHVDVCKCNTALFVDVSDDSYVEMSNTSNIIVTHWSSIEDATNKVLLKSPCKECGKRGCKKCKRCGNKIHEGQRIEFVFNDDEEGDITKEVVCPKCREEWDILDATTGYKELVQKRTNLFNEFFNRE